MNANEDAIANKAIEDWMSIIKDDLEASNKEASIRYNYDFKRDIPLGDVSSDFYWFSDDSSPKESIFKPRILVDLSLNVSQYFKRA
ncbi:unnamed protein product [Blepharisma stoltei]|uniref:Cyclin-dependent kinase inhibitor domain-containing protein n=1 Tax=Blepharisma stoltei TaxID=1481888 RepID=A0AAU9JLS7_9CILI|nr:unnamed protein product [Blepharisma stoltei]